MMPADAMNSHCLSFLLEELVRVPPVLDAGISGLTLDSRRVQRGDLFIALAGHRVHGIDYAARALSAGAAAIIWEPAATVDCEPPELRDAGIPVFAIERLGQYVGLIADRFYGSPSREMFVTGITGTDGKTSCSHFIAQALGSLGPACGVIGTMGYGRYGALQEGTHTTPDAVVLHAELARIRGQGAPCIIMEVSSHALVQGRVNGVAFDVVVLTNLSRDHLDYHGDVENYSDAKRKLFFMPGVQRAVLNADDAFGRELLNDLPSDIDITLYGTDRALLERVRGTGTDWLCAEGIEAHASGLGFRVVGSGGQGKVRVNVLGRFNVSNLLASMAVMLARDVPFDQVLELLGKTQTVPGRMEPFGNPDSQPLVVVDYAHTPRALEQVLTALRDHSDGTVWCVFGAGGDRDRGKRPLMGEVAERLADRVVVTDDNPRHEDAIQIVMDILKGMQNPDSAYIERDRGQAIAIALANSGPGDVILVAGKGHEDYQQIGDVRRQYSDRRQVQALLGELGE